MRLRERTETLDRAKGIYPAIGAGPGYMVVPTGEFRCPRKGEWYLSGAVIEGYEAPNDLSQEYHIAKLVRARQRTYYETDEHFKDEGDLNQIGYYDSLLIAKTGQWFLHNPTMRSTVILRVEDIKED